MPRDGQRVLSDGAFERFLSSAIATILTLIFSWRILLDMQQHESRLSINAAFDHEDEKKKKQLSDSQNNNESRKSGLDVKSNPDREVNDRRSAVVDSHELNWTHPGISVNSCSNRSSVGIMQAETADTCVNSSNTTHRYTVTGRKHLGTNVDTGFAMMQEEDGTLKTIKPSDDVRENFIRSYVAPPSLKYDSEVTGSSAFGSLRDNFSHKLESNSRHLVTDLDKSDEASDRDLYEEMAAINSHRLHRHYCSYETDDYYCSSDEELDIYGRRMLDTISEEDDDELPSSGGNNSWIDAEIEDAMEYDSDWATNGPETDENHDLRHKYVPRSGSSPHHEHHLKYHRHHLPCRMGLDNASKSDDETERTFDTPVAKNAAVRAIELLRACDEHSTDNDKLLHWKTNMYNITSDINPENNLSDSIATDVTTLTSSESIDVTQNVDLLSSVGYDARKTPERCHSDKDAEIIMSSQHGGYFPNSAYSSNAFDQLADESTDCSGSLLNSPYNRQPTTDHIGQTAARVHMNNGSLPVYVENPDILAAHKSDLSKRQHMNVSLSNSHNAIATHGPVFNIADINKNEQIIDTDMNRVTEYMKPYSGICSIDSHDSANDGENISVNQKLCQQCVSGDMTPIYEDALLSHVTHSTPKGFIFVQTTEEDVDYCVHSTLVYKKYDNQTDKFGNTAQISEQRLNPFERGVSSEYDDLFDSENSCYMIRRDSDVSDVCNNNEAEIINNVIIPSENSINERRELDSHCESSDSDSSSSSSTTTGDTAIEIGNAALSSPLHSPFRSPKHKQPEHLKNISESCLNSKDKNSSIVEKPEFENNSLKRRAVNRDSFFEEALKIHKKSAESTCDDSDDSSDTSSSTEESFDLSIHSNNRENVSSVQQVANYIGQVSSYGSLPLCNTELGVLDEIPEVDTSEESSDEECQKENEQVVDFKVTNVPLQITQPNKDNHRVKDTDHPGKPECNSLNKGVDKSMHANQIENRDTLCMPDLGLCSINQIPGDKTVNYSTKDEITGNNMADKKGIDDIMAKYGIKPRFVSRDDVTKDTNELSRSPVDYRKIYDKEFSTRSTATNRPGFIDASAQTVRSYRLPARLFALNPERYFVDYPIETTTFVTEEYVNGRMVITETKEQAIQVEFDPSGAREKALKHIESTNMKPSALKMSNKRLNRNGGSQKPLPDEGKRSEDDSSQENELTFPDNFIPSYDIDVNCNSPFRPVGASSPVPGKDNLTTMALSSPVAFVSSQQYGKPKKNGHRYDDASSPEQSGLPVGNEFRLSPQGAHKLSPQCNDDNSASGSSSPRWITEEWTETHTVPSYDVTPASMDRSRSSAEMEMEVNQALQDVENRISQWSEAYSEFDSPQIAEDTEQPRQDFPLTEKLFQDPNNGKLNFELSRESPDGQSNENLTSESKLPLERERSPSPTIETWTEYHKVPRSSIPEYILKPLIDKVSYEDATRDHERCNAFDKVDSKAESVPKSPKIEIQESASQYSVLKTELTAAQSTKHVEVDKFRNTDSASSYRSSSSSDLDYYSFRQKIPKFLIEEDVNSSTSLDESMDMPAHDPNKKAPVARIDDEFDDISPYNSSENSEESHLPQLSSNYPALLNENLTKGIENEAPPIPPRNFAPIKMIPSVPVKCHDVRSEEKSPTIELKNPALESVTCASIPRRNSDYFKEMESTTSMKEPPQEQNICPPIPERKNLPTASVRPTVPPRRIAINKPINIQTNITPNNQQNVSLKPLSPVEKKIEQFLIQADEVDFQPDQKVENKKPYHSYLQQPVTVSAKNISHLHSLPPILPSKEKEHLREKRNEFISSPPQVTEEEKQKALGTTCWAQRPKPILKRIRGDSDESRSESSSADASVLSTSKNAPHSKTEVPKYSLSLFSGTSGVKDNRNDKVFKDSDLNESFDDDVFSRSRSLPREKARSLSDLLETSRFRRTATLPIGSTYSGVRLVRSPSTNLVRTPSMFFSNRAKSTSNLLETNIDTGESIATPIMLETDIDEVLKEQSFRVRSLVDLYNREPVLENSFYVEKKQKWEKTRSLSYLPAESNNQIIEFDDIDATPDVSQSEIRISKSLTKLDLPDWYTKSAGSRPPSRSRSPNSLSVYSPDTSYRFDTSRHDTSSQSISSEARFGGKRPVVIRTRVTRSCSPKPRIAPESLKQKDFELPSQRFRRMEKPKELQPIKSKLVPPSVLFKMQQEGKNYENLNNNMPESHIKGNAQSVAINQTNTFGYNSKVKHDAPSKKPIDEIVIPPAGGTPYQIRRPVKTTDIPLASYELNTFHDAGSLDETDRTSLNDCSIVLPNIADVATPDPKTFANVPIETMQETFRGTSYENPLYGNKWETLSSFPADSHSSNGFSVSVARSPKSNSLANSQTKRTHLGYYDKEHDESIGTDKSMEVQSKTDAKTYQNQLEITNDKDSNISSYYNDWQNDKSTNSTEALQYPCTDQLSESNIFTNQLRSSPGARRRDVGYTDSSSTFPEQTTTYEVTTPTLPATDDRPLTFNDQISPKENWQNYDNESEDNAPVLQNLEMSPGARRSLRLRNADPQIRRRDIDDFDKPKRFTTSANFSLQPVSMRSIPQKSLGYDTKSIPIQSNVPFNYQRSHEGFTSSNYVRKPNYNSIETDIDGDITTSPNVVCRDTSVGDIRQTPVSRQAFQRVETDIDAEVTKPYTMPQQRYNANASGELRKPEIPQRQRSAETDYNTTGPSYRGHSMSNRPRYGVSRAPMHFRNDQRHASKETNIDDELNNYERQSTKDIQQAFDEYDFDSPASSIAPSPTSTCENIYSTSHLDVQLAYSSSHMSHLQRRWSTENISENVGLPEQNIVGKQIRDFFAEEKESSLQFNKEDFKSDKMQMHDDVNTCINYIGNKESKSHVNSDTSIESPYEKEASLSDVLDSLLALPKPTENVHESTSDEDIKRIASTSSRRGTLESISELKENLYEVSPATKTEFKCVEFNSKTESRNAKDILDENDVIVKCRNNLCEKMAKLSDARLSYKSCHNCYTYYCGRNCRHDHWETHKKRCVYARLNSTCKRVIRCIHDNPEYLRTMSELARECYVRKGRGTVLIKFPNTEKADQFLKSGLKSPDFSANYYSISDLTNTGILNEYESVVVEPCREYNPSIKYVLTVSIDVDSVLPKKPVPSKYNCRSIQRCVKLRLCRNYGNFVSNNKMCINQHVDSLRDTLILTAVPGTSSNSIDAKQARELCFMNIQRKLRDRGVNLKNMYPFVYQELIQYVDSDKHFSPMTIYPTDFNTCKSFMCLIMPDSEPDIEWIQSSGVIQELDLDDEPNLNL